LVAIKPKDLNRITKIGKGHICLREEKVSIEKKDFFKSDSRPSCSEKNEDVMLIS